MTRPVKVDHLQSCSRIFQSDQTKMDYSIWSTKRNFRNFGFNGNKAPPWTDPLSGGYEGLSWQRYIQVIYPTTFSRFLLKFCHTLLTNLTNIKPKTVENKILVEFKIYCVVPENIHTPTMEGIGNLEGMGRSEAQDIPEGRGGWTGSISNSVWKLLLTDLVNQFRRHK